MQNKIPYAELIIKSLFFITLQDLIMLKYKIFKILLENYVYIHIYIYIFFLLQVLVHNKLTRFLHTFSI